jgi:hypothetical protein
MKNLYFRNTAGIAEGLIRSLLERCGRVVSVDIHKLLGSYDTRSIDLVP